LVLYNHYKRAQISNLNFNQLKVLPGKL